MSNQRLTGLAAALVIGLLIALIFQSYQKCGWDYRSCPHPRLGFGIHR